MASLNRVQLIGYVGADVEQRYTPNGDAVCNFRLATTDTWKDRQSGEKREATEWHRIVCFRKDAEFASQYVKKGSHLYLEGRIKTRKWQDKEGNDRYTTEIEVTDLLLLGNRRDGRTGGSPDGNGSFNQSGGPGGGVGNGVTPPSQNKTPAFSYGEEEDIPFGNPFLSVDPHFAKATARPRRLA